MSRTSSVGKRNWEANRKTFWAVGSAPVALLVALLVAIVVFGPMSGRSLGEVATSTSEAAKAMAMILLVIGASGVSKEVLVSAGNADYIGSSTSGWNFSPLLLTGVIADLLRIAL